MTDQRVCDACREHPVHDTFRVCGRCQHVTQTHLRDMENHRRELLTVLARQTRYNEQAETRGSDPNLAWARIIDDAVEDVDITQHPVPYGRAAARLLHSQRAMLVSWCRLVADEFSGGLPGDTVPAMAAHLSRWSGRLAQHPAASEYVHEVRQLVRSVWAVVDAPQVRTEFRVGPCPNDYANPDADERDWCPGQVWARIPADENHRPTMHCDGGCDSIWYSEQWHNVGALIMRRKQLEGQVAA